MHYFSLYSTLYSTKKTQPFTTCVFREAEKVIKISKVVSVS